MDGFKRLHRPYGNLVGEDLALLVGDRLSVNRKGVLLMFSESMHEAIGIGGYTWSRKRNQRTN